MTDITLSRELRAQLMAELGFVLEPYGAAGPIVVEESLAGEVTRDATLVEVVLWKLVLEAASQWRPIETAPKGVMVLLISTHKTRLPIVGDWGLYDVYNQPKFTHWMPLPSQPKEPT